MRLKANYPQRVAMLIFMIAVCLWAAWPDWRLIVVVVLAGIAAGLYLLVPRRQH